MRVQVTQFAPHGSTIIVALVDSRYTLTDAALPVLKQVAAHFPARPVMLVSIEPNGFRAYAPFQTGKLLALLQLETLTFEEIDLSTAPLDQDAELPF